MGLRSSRSRWSRQGYGMVGLLVTMVCIVILMVVGLSALNTAVTGDGSAISNSVRSGQDKVHLYALYQGLAVGANENHGWLVVPSVHSGTKDRTVDTTANLWSLMIMQRYVLPQQAVSGNEYNGTVSVYANYDYFAYEPAQGVWWDRNFKADLMTESHTSFAHMPLFGERFHTHWRAHGSATMPLFGNRGPKDGKLGGVTYTIGDNGQWGGHILFGDGHIGFFTTFTPPGVMRQADGGSGGGQPDSVFSMDEGADGGDAILSFTRRMGENGPELQFD